MYDDRDEVVQLYLDDIIPNRFQPREVFDEKALKELAVSIKEHGVIQPIIVRNVNGKYEIIAGERRYKASALAGLTKIPAIIRDLDDKESSKVALLENLQRKNLNPIEEARTYQKILEIDQMTQEELAKTMGKSQSAVANKIRLLSLSDEVQDALLKEQISERHARALINVSDTNIQKELLKKIIETKMSVRSLEEEVKELYPKEEKKEIVPKIETPVNLVASTSDFVNNSPLVPTAEIPKDEVSNYGKVVIAPPSTDVHIPSINEDNKEEEENSDFEEEINNENEDAVEEDKVKDNNNARGAALDNLLNLNGPANMNPDNYLTPAEHIVKADPYQNIPKQDDYFQTPDFTTVQMATVMSSQNKESYTIEEATSKIRDLVEDIKVHGINISADEMNFAKSYQIIIKIDKTPKE